MPMVEPAISPIGCVKKQNCLWRCHSPAAISL
ncbi:Uncharacterised protein [Vibrio cholerae]|nr:Uncharacterised protein [Vibrio cholerae]